MPLIERSNPNNTVRFSPVGECIYCGRTDRLSDEHIIPVAIGGGYLLPSASCPTCRDTTSRFERKVLRGFMHDARTVGGFPTRRPKLRPTTIEYSVERGGRIETVQVPIDQATALLQMPLLKPPGVLQGRTAALGVEVVGYETIGFGRDLSEFQKTLGAERVSVTCDWDITSYVRLIAKVAYGFAVGHNGLMPRGEIPILPLILGQADDAGVWLGSMEFTLAIESEGPVHAIATSWADDPGRPGRRMFVARVKMFADAGTTGMGVVVWRPAVP